ncbi:HCP-like protein [Gonapodya prolifera JEL478]|uniref:HCP-like protein n=1 Tax=Gonapodya prolifera (strain JEL478) TaxID=1344416 RepID=A0A139A4J9_GONPJ|nr:HCP-like protein [Gonapodya prolifera JEL478]|eukprot:KXS11722.1 HCP-like protein [Gonapodya prolifera JEL478]
MRPDTFYQKNFPEADLLADMPDELQALMRQCWATKPEDRPQSFDQICDALEVLLKGTETEEDKFKQSMQPMVTAARNGGVDVQYALGSMFAGKIKGFPKDPALAIEFYELAAAKGHSDAQNELALYYYMGYPIAGILKNTKRAFELWGQAADKGHVDACHSLGHILMEGDEVQKDVRRALQLWMTAASGGDAHAKIDIGEMYLYGRGVEQNEEEARKWFRGVNYDGIASINTHSFSKTVALTSSDVKFVSKVPASVLCTMCKLAAVDPILDSCEKAHLFCRKCGTDLLFRNEPCPVSKTFWEITDYTDADDVQKILNILDVLCVKSPKCQWKGRYKLLVPHMLDCSHCSGEARLDVSDFYPQLQLGMSAFEVFMMQFGWDEEPAKNWQSRLPVADEVKNYESSYWWTTLIEGLIDEQRFTLLAPSFVFTFCAKGSIYDSMSNWANVVFFFRKPSDYNRKNPPSPKFVGTSVRFTGFAEVNGRAMMEKLLRFFGYTSDRLRNIKGAWATDWCVKDADYGFRENVVVSGRRALLEATMKIAANPEEHSHEIHVNLTDAEFIPEY